MFIAVLIIAALALYMNGPTRATGIWQGPLYLAALFAIMPVVAAATSLRARRRVGAQGIPVNAAIVQAPARMYRTGFGTAPCQVVFSFDPSVNDDPGRLTWIAEAVFDLKRTRPADPELAQIAGLVTAERHTQYRRTPLPASLTGGAVVYVGGLEVSSTDLRGRRLSEDQRVLPCLAEPGSAGGIEPLSWRVQEACAPVPA